MVETSDLKLTALALPQSADDGWLAAELDKYRVDSAPPYVLAPEEVERDKALARHPERGDEWDEAEADEDVNGFFATNAGKRARKKVSMHNDGCGRTVADGHCRRSASAGCRPWDRV